MAVELAVNDADSVCSAVDVPVAVSVPPSTLGDWVSVPRGAGKGVTVAVAVAVPVGHGLWHGVSVSLDDGLSLALGEWLGDKLRLVDTATAKGDAAGVVDGPVLEDGTKL